VARPLQWPGRLLHVAVSDLHVLNRPLKAGRSRRTARENILRGLLSATESRPLRAYGDRGRLAGRPLPCMRPFAAKNRRYEKNRGKKAFKMRCRPRKTVVK